MGADNPSLCCLDFVALDVETTGLSPWRDQIVEIAALRFALDGSEIGELSQLVHPRRRIPEAARRVHGITNEMVHGMPSINVVLPEFLEFIADGCGVLLAHNADFDAAFVKAALSYSRFRPASLPVVDTIPLFRTLQPQSTGFRLSDLAKDLSLPAPRHRALDDARVMKCVFIKLVGQTPSMRTLSDLFSASPPTYFV
jgi:DNA polymerase III epsilon subunit family exonuclease